MKYCKGCGDEIIFTKEEIQLSNKGYISLRDIKYCTDCHKQLNELPDEDIFSDADPGL